MYKREWVGKQKHWSLVFDLGGWGLGLGLDFYNNNLTFGKWKWSFTAQFGPLGLTRD